jgi:tRNA uridine 5-carbamoylmethylation protein Kti12
MKKIFLFFGPPGTGKTTLVEKLSQKLISKKLSTFRIEVDNLINMITNYKYQNNEKDSIWFKLLLNIVEFVEDKFDYILIEGLFYEEECILEIINKYPESQVFQLKCSIETCLKRNKNRKRQDEILDDEEIINLYTHKLKHKYIKINSEDNIKLIIEEIIKYV